MCNKCDDLLKSASLLMMMMLMMMMMVNCLKPHVLLKVSFSDVVSKRGEEVNKCLKYQNLLDQGWVQIKKPEVWSFTKLTSDPPRLVLSFSKIH